MARLTTMMSTPDSFGDLLARLDDPLGSLGSFELSAGAAPIPGERGASIPWEFVRAPLNVGTSTSGGYSVGVPTITHANAPRGVSAIEAAGMTILPIARDTPAVPFVSGTSTAGWLAAEGDAVPESDLTVGRQASAPKTLGFYMNISRKLQKLGGPAADLMIRRQMHADLFRALDAGVLAGTGADGQISGIGTIAGTVSVAGAALSYATILDGLRQILAAGARLADLKFIVGSQTWETLSARERASGSGYVIDDGRINGVEVIVSPDAPTDALYCGPWADAMLLLWGQIDVFSNPFYSPQTGATRLRIMADVDLLVPFPGTFLKSTSVT